MRENIGLFKAKTSSQVNGWNTRNKPDGEWVTGFYRDKVGLPVISQFEFNVADYVDYEIDPETLCECTGLKDKNGKLIFENDIVWLKIEDDRDYETDGYVEAEVCWIIEKEYDEPAYCGFGLRVIKSDKWFEKGEEYLRQEDLNFDISLFETEVIGNKFSEVESGNI